MTPEEIAKLAEHLFHSCVANRLWTPAPGKKQKFTDAVLPILTAHLAAREAEYARLREAAEKSAAAFEHYQMTCREHRSPYIKENGRHGSSPYAEIVESCQDLRAALTPQQEPGK